MTVGPALAGVGILLLAGLGADPNYLRDILPGVLLFGLGLSATVAPLTATVLDAVPPGRVGLASGVNNAVARVAGLLAIAVVGALIAGQFGHTLEREVGELERTPTVEHVLDETRAAVFSRGSELEELTDVQRPVVEAAALEASADALKLSLFICGLLMFIGAATSFLGLPRQVGKPAGARE
jgi:hypothetical protein